MEIAKATKDRRGFLAAALGGVAGLLAGRIAQPQTVHAVEEFVVLGGAAADNTAVGMTEIVAASGEACGLAGQFYDATNSLRSAGLRGVGVAGGFGLWGEGDVGVNAIGSGFGVLAQSPETAVRAYGATGVSGESPDGIGVHAIAGYGGVALEAEAGFGIGVRATADLEGGSALVVDGVSLFLKRSGKVNINAGASSKTVNAAPIYTQSLVLATIQGDVAGLFVRGVKLSPGAGTFTLHLNKPAPSTVKVGWFIVN
ncbi:MAG: hypothetical protein WEB00_14540 [Dehalococcoidia bacterium]